MLVTVLPALMPTFQQPSALWNPLWQTLFRFIVFVCSVVTEIMPYEGQGVKRIEIDAPQIVKREGVKRDAIFSDRFESLCLKRDSQYRARSP